MDISIGLAFLAGLASFLTPCVFSLVPAYIGYLGGRSAAISQVGRESSRWDTFKHGITFVLGFSFVFILLGLAVSALGSLIYDARGWLAKIGGVVVVLFGLHMTGLLRIPFLEYDLRPQSKVEQNRSYFSSFLLGIFFSAGWSPCVGPVLGSILLIALNDGSIIQGFQLLTAYSVGMAVPFLIAALGVGWVTQMFRKHNRFLKYVEVVMGIILVIVGVMLFLGTFERLARFGYLVDFGL
jgi:cytochrome c-type biogenesis protein